jgi:hypothetical protein
MPYLRENPLDLTDPGSNSGRKGLHAARSVGISANSAPISRDSRSRS